MADTGYTLPFFLQTYHYPDGLPLSGGKLYFYVAGSTNISKNVYADREKTIPLTQPIVLDAGGTAQQYFAEDGLYKIVLTTSTGTLVATRDYIDGAGGSGAGGDAFTVKANPTDTAPATLIEKMQNTASVIWNTGSVSGVQKIWADVDPSAVLDYKVKADPSDPVPDFLDTKVENGYYVEMWVNPTTHKIQANFTGPAYVPVTGGVYTGPVTIPTLTSTTVNATTINATTGTVTGTWDVGVLGATTVNATTTNTQNLVISGLAGSNNNVLMVNSSGTVYKVNDPLYKVKISSGDPTPGYLGTKVYPGAGIAINVSNDPVNGDNINISLIDPPLSLPSGQVGYGSGSGVTSSSRLVYTQPGTSAATLMVDKTELDTYYVGGHQYTSWANISAGSSNFRDAINQRDDGVICIGGGGDSGVIKLWPSTRAVDFGIFSTVTVGGKFIGPSVDESLATSYVPELLPGEEKVVRFIRSTGTTLISNATQQTYYRSSTTGVSSVAAASNQVDSSLIFGSGASCKVGVVKFIGVSSTAVQAIY